MLRTATHDETNFQDQTFDADSTSVEIAALNISRRNFADTITLLGNWMIGDQPRRVATANVDFLRLASKNQRLRGALQSCDLVTADGQPLVWLSRLIGQPIPERVAGSDLAWPLLEEASRRRASVYFLGGGPGVAQRAADAARARVDGLLVAGASSPFIDWDDPAAASAVADEARASGARLLLVALGCPKQELFLQRYLARTGASVGIGVGATLDFLAGGSQRAPQWMRSSGLEWMHRLAQEPARLASRYLHDASYLLRLTGSSLSQRRSSRPAVQAPVPRATSTASALRPDAELWDVAHLRRRGLAPRHDPRSHGPQALYHG